MQLFCSDREKISRSHGVYFDQWELSNNPRLRNPESSNWRSKKSCELTAGYLTPGFIAGLSKRNFASFKFLEINPSESWRHWKQDFEDSSEAFPYSEGPEKTKTALFMRRRTATSFRPQALARENKNCTIYAEKNSHELSTSSLVRAGLQNKCSGIFSGLSNEIFASFKFLEINPSESWRHWKQDFEDSSEAFPYSEGPEKTKTALFMRRRTATSFRPQALARENKNCTIYAEKNSHELSTSSLVRAGLQNKCSGIFSGLSKRNFASFKFLEINPSESWRHWKQDFEDSSEAFPYSEGPEKTKTALFMRRRTATSFRPQALTSAREYFQDYQNEIFASFKFLEINPSESWRHWKQDFEDSSEAFPYCEGPEKTKTALFMRRRTATSFRPQALARENKNCTIYAEKNSYELSTSSLVRAGLQNKCSGIFSGLSNEIFASFKFLEINPSESWRHWKQDFEDSSEAFPYSEGPEKTKTALFMRRRTATSFRPQALTSAREYFQDYQNEIFASFKFLEINPSESWRHWKQDFEDSSEAFPYSEGPEKTKTALFMRRRTATSFRPQALTSAREYFQDYQNEIFASFKFLEINPSESWRHWKQDFEDSSEAFPYCEGPEKTKTALFMRRRTATSFRPQALTIKRIFASFKFLEINPSESWRHWKQDFEDSSEAFPYSEGPEKTKTALFMRRRTATSFRPQALARENKNCTIYAEKNSHELSTSSLVRAGLQNKCSGIFSGLSNEFFASFKFLEINPSESWRHWKQDFEDSSEAFPYSEGPEKTKTALFMRRRTATSFRPQALTSAREYFQDYQNEIFASFKFLEINPSESWRHWKQDFEDSSEAFPYSEGPEKTKTALFMRRRTATSFRPQALTSAREYFQDYQNEIFASFKFLEINPSESWRHWKQDFEDSSEAFPYSEGPEKTKTALFMRRRTATSFRPQALARENKNCTIYAEKNSHELSTSSLVRADSRTSAREYFQDYQNEIFASFKFLEINPSESWRHWKQDFEDSSEAFPYCEGPEKTKTALFMRRRTATSFRPQALTIKRNFASFKFLEINPSESWRHWKQDFEDSSEAFPYSEGPEKTKTALFMRRRTATSFRPQALTSAREYFQDYQNEIFASFKFLEINPSESWRHWKQDFEDSSEAFPYSEGPEKTKTALFMRRRTATSFRPQALTSAREYFQDYQNEIFASFKFLEINPSESWRHWKQDFEDSSEAFPYSEGPEKTKTALFMRRRTATSFRPQALTSAREYFQDYQNEIFASFKFLEINPSESWRHWKQDFEDSSEAFPYSEGPEKTKTALFMRRRTATSFRPQALTSAREYFQDYQNEIFASFKFLEINPSESWRHWKQDFEDSSEAFPYCEGPEKTKTALFMRRRTATSFRPQALARENKNCTIYAEKNSHELSTSSLVRAGLQNKCSGIFSGLSNEIFASFKFLEINPSESWRHWKQDFEDSSEAFPYSEGPEKTKTALFMRRRTATSFRPQALTSAREYFQDYQNEIFASFKFLEINPSESWRHWKQDFEDSSEAFPYSEGPEKTKTALFMRRRTATSFRPQALARENKNCTIYAEKNSHELSTSSLVRAGLQNKCSGIFSGLSKRNFASFKFLEINPSESWRHWKQDFEDSSEAFPYCEGPEKTKTALFMRRRTATSFRPQALTSAREYFQDYQNEIFASFKFLEINPSESWRHWKQDFEDSSEAFPYSEGPEKTKTALFMRRRTATSFRPQALTSAREYFQDYQNEIFASFKFLEINPSESWRHWKQDFEDSSEAFPYCEGPEKTKTALFMRRRTATSFRPQALTSAREYFQDYQNEIFASFKFLEINPSESWRHWKQDFEDSSEAFPYSEGPEKTKTALFMRRRTATSFRPQALARENKNCTIYAEKNSHELSTSSLVRAGLQNKCSGIFSGLSKRNFASFKFLEINPSESWRHWKQDFEDSSEAFPYCEGPEKTKTALFMRRRTATSFRPQALARENKNCTIYAEKNSHELSTSSLVRAGLQNKCSGIFSGLSNEFFASFKFLEINPSESWRHWKQDFEDSSEAFPYSEGPEKTKTALFMRRRTATSFRPQAL
ncbi:hypothetical protein TNCV_3416401 [Trichonephila clavipes]|nr:hypothetical protein TNCV_3416401 [Trichonephila clavipes]